jgi:iron(III) transport system substrate-binding protein
MSGRSAPENIPNRFIFCLFAAILAGLAGGCRDDRPKAQEQPEKWAGARTSRAAADEPVVVYTSVDEEFARQVLDAFEERTGQGLAVVFDSEAGKTTGLIQRIEAEAAKPRCDVLWSSELFNTILLARRGLLEPYVSVAAADIPDRYNDPEHRWTAVGLRARVLAFDPRKVPADQVPTHWEEIAKASLADRLAFANPLFGTTRGHVAAMFALWGPERSRQFLTRLRDNRAIMLDGNSAAVRAVMNGEALFAMTDTDDVWVAQRRGASIDLRYLDMGDGGTLLVPCSVALIKGGPAGNRAREVVDFLVSAEVERMLAKSDSRNIPVRASLRKELQLELPPETEVSFVAIADAMEPAVQAVRDILIR